MEEYNSIFDKINNYKYKTVCENVIHKEIYLKNGLKSINFVGPEKGRFKNYFPAQIKFVILILRTRRECGLDVLERRRHPWR